MAKHPTTFRLDQDLHKKAKRKAEKLGMTLSGVIHILLAAFVRGEIDIDVVKYPKAYLEKIYKEIDEMDRLRRAGKLKSYASGKEMMDDILGKGWRDKKRSR